MDNKGVKVGRLVKVSEEINWSGSRDGIIRKFFPWEEFSDGPVGVVFPKSLDPIKVFRFKFSELDKREE